MQLIQNIISLIFYATNGQKNWTNSWEAWILLAQRPSAAADVRNSSAILLFETPDEIRLLREEDSPCGPECWKLYCVSNTCHPHPWTFCPCFFRWDRGGVLCVAGYHHRVYLAPSISVLQLPLFILPHLGFHQLECHE